MRRGFGSFTDGSGCVQPEDCASGICCALNYRNPSIPSICAPSLSSCVAQMNEMERVYCAQVGGVPQTQYYEGLPVVSCLEPEQPQNSSSFSPSASVPEEKGIGIPLPVVAVAAIVIGALLIF